MKKIFAVILVLFMMFSCFANAPFIKSYSWSKPEVRSGNVSIYKNDANQVLCTWDFGDTFGITISDIESGSKYKLENNEKEIGTALYHILGLKDDDFEIEFTEYKGKFTKNENGEYDWEKK